MLQKNSVYGLHADLFPNLKNPVSQKCIYAFFWTNSVFGIFWLFLLTFRNLIFRKGKKNFCCLNKLVCCYTKSPLFFSKILKQVHACLFLTEVVSIILTNEIPIVYINKVVSFARSKKDQRKLFHSNVTLLYVPSKAYLGPCHTTMF